MTGRLASRYSATGQTNRRIETEPIRRRTQRAFLKSRSLRARLRMSAYDRSVRFQFQKCPFSAKGIIVTAKSHRGHESMPMKYTPIQTVTKTKMGTSSMHRSRKLYIQPIVNNEGNADAKREWGRMTPSPNEIVGEKSGAKRSEKRRQKATTNLSPVVASARQKVSPFVARTCRFLSLSQRNWISL